MKGDVLTVQKMSDDRFHDLLGRFLSLLAFTFCLVRLFRVPGGRKTFPGCIVTGGWEEPEPVHKVKVRIKWQNGMVSASDECGKDAVTKKPFYPESKGRLGELHRDHKEEKG